MPTNADIRSVGPLQPEIIGLPTRVGLWIVGRVGFVDCRFV